MLAFESADHLIGCHIQGSKKRSFHGACSHVCDSQGYLGKR